MVRRAVAILAILSALSLSASGGPPRPGLPTDPRSVSVDAGTSPGAGVPATGIAASPDGSWAYLPSADGLRVLKVDASTGHVSRAAALLAPVERTVSSADGALMGALSSTGARIDVLNAEDLTTAASLVTAAGPRAAVFAPDGALLHVACSSAQTLQTFEIASGLVVKATSLPGTPGELLLAGGGRLVVALPEAGVLLALDAASLEILGTCPLPPGSSRLALSGKVLLASSELSDLVTLIDAESLDVLKTLSLTDPGAVDALGGLGLVAKHETKVVALQADPFDAEFGESRTTTFLAAGAALLRGAKSGVLALSADRSRLTTVPTAAVEDRSFTASVVPSRGVPGSRLYASGGYGSGTSAIFQRNEAFEERGIAENLTESSFDVELPLATPLGTTQLWVSRTSEGAIDGKSFVAASPADVEAIGTLEAIDDLIAELERQAADTGLAAAAISSLRAAIDALRRARAFLVHGQVRDGLLALVVGFDAIEQAGTSGAGVGAVALGAVQIVQYTVFSKLDPVRRQLGEKDEDVKAALQEFAVARTRLRQGKLREAIRGYVSAYEAVEVAIAKARRLRPAQAVTILRRAADDMGRLRNLAHTRLITGHGHHSTGTPLHSALARIGRSGQLKGTALGHLTTFRVPEAVAQMKAAVAAFALEGHDTEDLEELACSSAHRLVLAIADAVEANVGPFDPVVARARRFLGECETKEAAGDHAGMMDSLESALGSPLSATTSSSQLQLFQATSTDTTECHPTVKIGPLPSLCLDPDTGIDPNPMKFRVELGADVANAYGYLFCSIKRSKGGQVIKTFDTRDVVAPSTELYEWNGKDDGNQIAKMKGAGCEDEFVVEVEFICYSSLGEPHAAADQRSFAIVGHDGILIEPSHVDLCASDAHHQSTYQFRAFTCQAGGGRVDVTDKCTWTLDNPQIGEIKKGLFKAKANAKGKGKITAVLADYHCPGKATVTVTPESGGIVEPSVDLCVNGTYDFDVVKGCNADNTATPANDQDYFWNVSDPAKGSVTMDGFFRALAKGKVTVTASNPETGEFHTAIVNITDIDEIDVVHAPAHPCIQIGETHPFTVQVFCNAMPKDGVTVDFSAEEWSAAGRGGSGAVALDPFSQVTAGGGLATTQVTALSESTEPYSTNLIAKAQEVEATAPINIAQLSIVLQGVPQNMCVGDSTGAQALVTCGGAAPPEEFDVRLRSGGSVLINGQLLFQGRTTGGVLNFTLSAVSATASGLGTRIEAFVVGKPNVSTFATVHVLEAKFRKKRRHIDLGSRFELEMTYNSMTMLKIVNRGRGRVKIERDGTLIDAQELLLGDAEDPINVVRLIPDLSSDEKDDIQVKLEPLHDPDCGDSFTTMVGGRVEWFMERLRPRFDMEAPDPADRIWEVIVSATVWTEKRDKVLAGRSVGFGLLGLANPENTFGSDLDGVSNVLEDLEQGGSQGVFDAVTNAEGQVFARVLMVAKPEEPTPGSTSDLRLVAAVSHDGNPAFPQAVADLIGPNVRIDVNEGEEAGLGGLRTLNDDQPFSEISGTLNIILAEKWKTTFEEYAQYLYGAPAELDNLIKGMVAKIKAATSQELDEKVVRWFVYGTIIGMIRGFELGILDDFAFLKELPQTAVDVGKYIGTRVVEAVEGAPANIAKVMQQLTVQFDKAGSKAGDAGRILVAYALLPRARERLNAKILVKFMDVVNELGEAIASIDEARAEMRAQIFKVATDVVPTLFTHFSSEIINVIFPTNGKTFAQTIGTWCINELKNEKDSANKPMFERKVGSSDLKDTPAVQLLAVGTVFGVATGYVIEGFLDPILGVAFHGVKLGYRSLSALSKVLVRTTGTIAERVAKIKRVLDVLFAAGRSAFRLDPQEKARLGHYWIAFARYFDDIHPEVFKKMFNAGASSAPKTERLAEVIFRHGDDYTEGKKIGGMVDSLVDRAAGGNPERLAVNPADFFDNILFGTMHPEGKAVNWTNDRAAVEKANKGLRRLQETALQKQGNSSAITSKVLGVNADGKQIVSPTVPTEIGNLSVKHGIDGTKIEAIAKALEDFPDDKVIAGFKGATRAPAHEGMVKLTGVTSEHFTGQVMEIIFEQNAAKAQEVFFDLQKAEKLVDAATARNFGIRVREAGGSLRISGNVAGDIRHWSSGVVDTVAESHAKEGAHRLSVVQFSRFEGPLKTRPVATPTPGELKTPNVDLIGEVNVATPGGPEIIERTGKEFTNFNPQKIADRDDLSKRLTREIEGKWDDQIRPAAVAENLQKTELHIQVNVGAAHADVQTLQEVCNRAYGKKKKNEITIDIFAFYDSSGKRLAKFRREGKTAILVPD